MHDSKSKALSVGSAGKYYRIIKLIVAAMSAAVFVAVVVLTAIYVPREIKRVEEQKKAQTNIIRYSYCLAIDYQDREGVAIPDEWAQGLDFSEFSYQSDNPLVKVNSGKLVAQQGTSAGTKAVITYKLGGKTACVIYAHVVKADGYIASLAELAELDDANGTFIQTEDIIIQGALSIINFRGNYYGNHNALSGQDIGLSDGGVFNNASYSGFYGIVLTNIKGDLAAQRDASYGALLDTGDYCTIQYCSAEGGFAVSDMSGASKIGGIVGDLLGSRRLSNEYINTDYINACTTNLDIQVIGARDNPRIGGIVGEAINIVISNTTVRGSLQVNIANATAINKMYVGGVAGKLYKEYDTAVLRINYLDSSYNLTSEAKIQVSLIGGGQSFNEVFVGGAFGSITNQTVRNFMCAADINIDGGSPDIFAGGVAGQAENELKTIRMYIDATEIAACIVIGSSGNLYGGGLVGKGISIDIEDTVATLTPEVIGDRVGVITKVSDTIGGN